jgi:hypothetical protein
VIVPRIHSRRAMLAAAALPTLVILAIGAGTAEAAGPVGFAATGRPGSTWPSFSGGHRASALSLVAPRPLGDRDLASRHHCAFWDAVQ